MRRTATCLGFLMCCSLTAHAGGLNLSWDHCSADGAPVSNRAFGCLSNTGEETLVGSFVLSVPLSGMVRMTAQVEFLSPTTASFPAWLLDGGCAELALQAAPYLPGTDVNCHDWTGLGGAGATTSTYHYPAGDPRRGTITLVSTTPVPGSPAQANVEYFALRIRITHDVLAGPGACGGCSTPLTIALNFVSASNGPSTQNLVLPVSGTSNRVTWQTSGPTAARNMTWSAVKSLYR